MILDRELSSNVVNVASVPHRSPFRYPGGKTWFVPTLRRWLAASEKKPKYFIEPFAGGGIVGLTVAFESLAEKVVMIELDEDVSSVWNIILSKENHKLAKMILNFEMSLNNVETLFAQNSRSTLQKAFKTIVRNRVSHAGIMAPGAGLTKGGEGGRGISSRWYPETLAKRILDIQLIAPKISFIQGSAFDELPKYLNSSKNSIFVDPPYTAAGKKAGSRLYKYSQLDHTKLFNLFEDVRADFLFTYDDSLELRQMASKRNFQTTLIAMKNSHHAKMSELLISKEFEWLQNN